MKQYEIHHEMDCTLKEGEEEETFKIKSEDNFKLLTICKMIDGDHYPKYCLKFLHHGYCDITTGRLGEGSSTAVSCAANDPSP